MAQRSPTYRYSSAYSTPARPRKKRSRGVRRLLVLCFLLALALVVGRAYVLHVYAPGLRAEAQAVPRLVRAQLAQQGAPYASLSAISPNLQNAIVAIEDQRFYHHPGIDIQGMVRALWVDLTNGRLDQGGSTLEQQLAKRAIVRQDSTIHDKLRIIGLAWAVDQEFTKRQILELYLNAAYYGQGAYGAAEAARVYFGTDVSQLTLPQAAFLAALPQAPSVYGAHPTAPAVVIRQHTVLQDMEAQGYITASQEQQALSSKLSFALPNL